MENKRTRALWVGALCTLLWGAIGARLWFLQVKMGEQLAQEAMQQRALSLPVADRRGAILDRDGLPLTDSEEVWGVGAFPPLITEKSGAARALAPLLGLEEELLMLRLWGQRPMWLAMGVSAEVAGAVERLALPGVSVAPVTQRYGAGSIARHVVGYINESGGVLGLEAQYDAALSDETAGALVAYLDGRGRPLHGLGVSSLQATGKPPYDLYTTIDGRIQRAVERTLDRESPGRAGIVVLDPATGDLLAMASRPDFDQAQDPGRRPDDGDAFLFNRALMALEPGSVLKPFVVAEALEAGLVQPDERFFCNGHYDVGGGYHPQCSLYPGGHGWLTLKEALERSCNVALMQIGLERMGADRIGLMLQRYGFGRPTPAALHGEMGGDLPDLHEAYQVAQVSFGQGLTATPLQVGRAIAAIANGGLMPPVQAVREIRAPDGSVVERPAPSPAVRVMHPETAQFLQAALTAVTDPDGQGTGRRAWIPGYGSAGKTGSAEGLDHGEPALHAWFAGYTPLESPRYVIVVMVQSGGAGGEIAAPLFRAVADAIFTAVDGPPAAPPEPLPPTAE